MSEETNKRSLRRIGYLRAAGFAVAIVLVSVLLVAGVWLNGVFSAHPRYNTSIEHPALSAPVSIKRDQFAIPRISAATEEDAFFALGFVHAQDRFWQMTVTKHFTQGRLTELFGAAVLDVDRSSRSLNLSAKVEEAWEAMPPADQARVIAYTEGINAWLNSAAYVRPAEFRILGLSPSAWTVEDSLFASKSTLVTLTFGVQMEKYAEALNTLNAGGEALVTDAYPADGHVSLDIEDLSRTMGLEITEPDLALEPQSINLVEETEQSNNWVVSGAWTESGQTLFAGDPHLPPSMPNIWYLAHMSWGSSTLVGGSVPGVPVMYLGLTNGIATSPTISMRDTQDVYIETINPDDPNEYLTPEGWAPFEERIETFQLKSGEVIEETFRSTRNGPIIPASVYTPSGQEAGSKTASMAWTALRETPDLTLSAIIQANRARTIDEWLGAMCGYVGPDVNIAFAHPDGTIGVLVAGRAPRRGPDHPTRGRMPSDGSDAQYDWDGMYACDQNARVINPDSGIIATANARVIPDAFPFSGEEYFGAPGRQQRIQDLLEARRDHTPDSFARIQTDGVSLDAVDLITSIGNPLSDNIDISSAFETLKTWDGDWRASGPAPVIFAYWRASLAETLLADEIEDPTLLHELSGDLPLAKILSENLAWCDDVNSVARESCSDATVAAMALALERAEQDHGKAAFDLSWSDVFRVKHPHIGFAGLAVLDGWFSRENHPDAGRGVPAGTGAPNIALIRKTEDGIFLADAFVPSIRMIIDYADLDTSQFVIPSGQSGHFRSPNYDDLQDLWMRGDYVTIPPILNEDDIVHETTLSPASPN